jgi:hypothetical protein
MQPKSILNTNREMINNSSDVTIDHTTCLLLGAGEVLDVEAMHVHSLEALHSVS